jgi:hypothetical protein
MDGTRPRIWRVAAAAATTTLVVATAGWIGLRHPATPDDSIGHSSAPASLAIPRGFVVSGHVTRLYPGRRARMKVHVRNRKPFAIRVTRISVTVRSRTHGCSGRNVRVRPFRGRLRVKARGRRLLRMRVRMIRAAPNACQGVRFTLRFHGRAVKP